MLGLIKRNFKYLTTEVSHWRLFTIIIFVLRFMEPETAVKLQFDSFS